MKRLKMNIGITYVEVIPLNIIDRSLILRYNERFQTYRYEYNRALKRKVKLRDKLFLAVNPETKGYRYTINSMEYLVIHLRRNGISGDQIDFEYDKTPHADKVNILFNDAFVPYKYQNECIDIISDLEKPIHLVPIQTGKGKAEFEENKVLTNNGPVKMKDIKIGDIVMSPKFEPRKVINVHPQGLVDLLEVTFVDGRSLKVSKDHLWKTYTYMKDEVISTEDIMELLRNQRYVAIDRVVPQEQVSCKVTACPKNVGKLLRDGLITSLQDNLVNWSYDQKLDFFSKLMDKPKTDINKEFFYFNENDKAFNVIKQIVYSMGGTINEFKTIEEVKSKHSFFVIRIPDPVLKKKLSIVSVTPCGMGKAKCITIDHDDGLYITENYVVTHNTLIASKTLSNIGLRTAVIILPKFIEKWTEDLVKNTKHEKEDIFIVRGSKSIKDLVKASLNNELNYKFIIFSTRTLANFIRDFELGLDVEESYGCTPLTISSLLGLGTGIYDEAHRDFHAVLKITLYFNLYKTIGLTATLKTLDPAIRLHHWYLFPDHLRVNTLDYDRYIHVHGVKYMFKNPKIIGPIPNYLHTDFETRMLICNETTKNYLDMIGNLTRDKFLNIRTSEQKLLIYASTIRMCTLIRDYLRRRYPQLKVERYTGDDPMVNIITSDICISTIGSAAEAFDIPNLIRVFNTVVVKSPVQNEQSLGRLRVIKGVTLIYYYLFCPQIDKHREFNMFRAKFFREITKLFTYESYDNPV